MTKEEILSGLVCGVLSYFFKLVTDIRQLQRDVDACHKAIRELKGDKPCQK